MPLALVVGTIIFSADFNICSEYGSQVYPSAIYAHDRYYVFWSDQRYYSTDRTYALFGARISATGTVLDPNGRLLYRDTCSNELSVAEDGANLMVVFREGC